MTTFEEMGLPTPKFRKGEVVFHIQKTTKEHRAACPDCLGTKLWTVKTPAGEEFQTSCSRCGGSYGSPPLRWWEPSFTIVRLTIGMTKINDWGEKDDIRYMCNETGIGSGSLYDEKNLFKDEAVARDVGNLWLEQAKVEYANKAETKHNVLSKELSAYTFMDAKVREAQHKTDVAEGKLRNLYYTLHDTASQNFYSEDYELLIKEELCRKFINHILTKAGLEPLEE